MRQLNEQPTGHDALVLSYLLKIGQSSPLLQSEIARAMLLAERDLERAAQAAERDLMRAEIDRLKSGPDLQVVRAKLGETEEAK